jgi:mutual gliding-motility protein MglA
MVVNHETGQIQFKIVYCGTPLGGKTTNLAKIHSYMDETVRGEMISMATSQDRTLFFDFLSLETPCFEGYQTRFQLYTVPGQIYYNATLQLVLRGVDGIVFVADAQRERLSENALALQNVEQNLQLMQQSLERIPVVLQYNKRELPNSASATELDAAINRRQRPFPRIEASAIQGFHVLETLNGICQLVLRRHGHDSISPAA